MAQTSISDAFKFIDQFISITGTDFVLLSLNIMYCTEENKYPLKIEWNYLPYIKEVLKYRLQNSDIVLIW